MGTATSWLKEMVFLEDEMFLAAKTFNPLKFLLICAFKMSGSQFWTLNKETTNEYKTQKIIAITIFEWYCICLILKNI